MTTSFTPRGNASSGAFMNESSFGALPSGDWQAFPFYKHTLAEKQAMQPDQLLGQARTNNRDPMSPQPDLPSLAGDLTLPLDLAYLGWWLDMCFGAVSTSGSSPDYVHTWNSGGEALPYRSLEFKLNTSLFYQYTGLIASGFDFDLGHKAGFDQMTLHLMGRKEIKATSSGAGSPVAAPGRVPVVAAVASVKIGGSLTGSISTAKITYSNGVVAQDFLGDPYPQGYDLDDEPALTGSFTARFRDATDYDLARIGANGIPGEQTLEFLWQNTSTRSLSLLCNNARFEPFGVPVQGPGGIQVTWNFRAEQSASSSMLTTTLKSPTASF